MKYRIPGIAVGYILGIILAVSLGGVDLGLLPFFCLGIGIIGMGWILFRQRQWRDTPIALDILLAVLAAFPLGYWRTQVMTDTSNPRHLAAILDPLPPNTPVRLRGVVSAEPELTSNTRGILRLRVEEIAVGKGQHWQPVRQGNVRVTVWRSRRGGDLQLHQLNSLMHPRSYGYRVEVETRYRPLRKPSNPGAFNYRAFLLQHNLHAAFSASVANVSVLEKSRGNPLVELALLAKQNFIATFKQTIRGPESRLAAAATLGLRRALDGVSFNGRMIVESFRHAGVGHVLAVSGLHVSIVSLLLYGLFSLTGLHPRRFVPVLILFLILFALLTGARPSSVRAVIMNAAVLLALAYLRCSLRTATSIGLALSAAIILALNPLTLFAPGFLLSFGAVLSLVVLAPPLEHGLSRLRGGSLILALLWFFVLFFVASFHFRLLLFWPSLVFAGGTLWLAIKIGTAWNERCPRLWRLGLEPLPAPLRYFVAAQLAIQLGMMIPLSAWFFGRLPLGGMWVNLLAIPAVGVLVQLGMLTGIVGLIPWCGLALATPLGAATALVARAFFYLADAGTVCFAYPATPKPTLSWMLAYYVGIFLVLLMAAHARDFLRSWYCLWGDAQHQPLRRIREWVMPVLVTLIGAILLIPSTPRLQSLWIYCAGDVPHLSITSSDRQALLINGGDTRAGQRLLFAGIRNSGAVTVDTAIMPSPDPRVGLNALDALLPLMHVDRVLLSVAADTPETYMDAIGDSYLSRSLAVGQPWAIAYPEGWADFLDAVREYKLQWTLFPQSPILSRPDLALRALALPARMPKRFTAAVKTRILQMRTGSFRWLIVTDAIDKSVAAMPSADLLLLPVLKHRPYYDRMLRAALAAASPRLVILCTEKEQDAIKAAEKVRRMASKLKLTPQILSPAFNGALQAQLLPDGLLEVRGLLGGCCVLSPAVAGPTENKSLPSKK